MALPPKAAANIQQGMRRLTTQPSNGETIVHFKVVRVGGPAGAARVLFGKRYNDCADAAFQKLYKDDPDLEGKPASSWFRVRGVARIRPGSIEIVPSTKDNRVLAVPAMLKHLKDVRKLLAAERLQVAGLARLLEAEAAKPEDVSRLVDGSVDEDDEPQDEGREDLRFDAPDEAKNREARGLVQTFNTLALDVESAVKLAGHAAAGKMDVEPARAGLTDVGARLRALRQRVALTRKDLLGAVFGKKRYKDSLAVLDELDARIGVETDRVDAAYHTIRGGHVMTGSEQGVAPSAKELEREREAQVVREDEARRSQRREDHSGAADPEVKALLEAWGAVRDAADVVLKSPDLEETRKTLAELRGEGGNPDLADKIVRGLANDLRDARRRADTLGKRAEALKRKHRGDPDGEDSLAAYDIAARAVELHAEIDRFLKDFAGIAPNARVPADHSGASRAVLSILDDWSVLADRAAALLDDGDLRGRLRTLGNDLRSEDTGVQKTAQTLLDRVVGDADTTGGAIEAFGKRVRVALAEIGEDATSPDARALRDLAERAEDTEARLQELVQDVLRSVSGKKKSRDHSGVQTTQGRLLLTAWGELKDRVDATVGEGVQARQLETLGDLRGSDDTAKRKQAERLSAGFHARAVALVSDVRAFRTRVEYVQKTMGQDAPRAEVQLFGDLANRVRAAEERVGKYLEALSLAPLPELHAKDLLVSGEDIAEAETLYNEAKDDPAAFRTKAREVVKRSPGALRALAKLPGGKELLDEAVAELGDSVPDDEDQEFVKHAMMARFDLTKLSGDLTTKALPRLYKVMGMVPESHTHENPFLSGVERHRKFEASWYSNREVVLNLPRLNPLIQAVMKDTVRTGEGDETTRTHNFDSTTLHEIAHAVDDNLKFMDGKAGDLKYGGWREHAPDEWRRLVIQETGFLDAFPTFPKKVLESVIAQEMAKADGIAYAKGKWKAAAEKDKAWPGADALRRDPGLAEAERMRLERGLKTADYLELRKLLAIDGAGKEVADAILAQMVYKNQPLDEVIEEKEAEVTVGADPDVEPDWSAIEAHKAVQLVRACRTKGEDAGLWDKGDGAAQTWAVNGRVYQQAYKTTWVSYAVAARTRRVTNYQFRAPGEWFSELYSAYYLGALSESHPDRAWFAREIDK